MTKSLQIAIERLQRMPADRQESLAKLLLHEIDEDERWMQSTAANSEKLQGLVDEVFDTDRRGGCEPLDPDQL